MYPQTKEDRCRELRRLEHGRDLENERSNKEQSESNGRRLTANTSQVSFFIIIRNTLEMLSSDHLSGLKTIGENIPQI